jgi:hypothetical protein
MSPSIPVINQTVPTPNIDLSANPFHAEPLESAVGPALAAGGAAVMNIAIRQRQQQNAIDSAQASNDFDDQLGKVKTEILNSGMSADAMATNFKTSSSELISAFTDPKSSPYPHVAPQLAVSLRNQVAPHLEAFPSEALARVFHDLDFKFQQQTNTAAATIGQNYTIAGTAQAPVFQLNADGMEAMQRQIKTIDQAYPPDARPTENQYYRNQLAQKSALQTGMSVAQDHPSLIDAYIKQHTDMLAPEQQMQLTNRATAAIDLPMRQINASNEATRAQLLQKFDGQVQSGTLDTAAVEHAAQFKLITGDDYQKYMGVPLAQPSDPGAVGEATTRIQNARTPEELDDIIASIKGDPNIRGKESIGLPAVAENAKRQMNTVGGKARITAESTVESAYDPHGLDGMITDKLNPGARTAAKRSALMQFRAATLNETDPAKINAAAREAVRANPGPTAPSRAPTAPPPAVTDDVAKKAAALGRARGLIH